MIIITLIIILKFMCKAELQSASGKQRIKEQTKRKL